MASVSSLDQDMRNLRMARYTPATANEARSWVEDTLGHPLPAGDLLEALKDGVALCQLANLALPAPGIKFKRSAMPFVQMENISHFLRACAMPPLNLPAHDRFLTVDLYEAKDPAQVLQCLGAFSRQAHAANPARFASAIGPKRAAAMSPASTGPGASNDVPAWRQPGSSRPPSGIAPSSAMPSSARAMSPALTGGSTGSQSSSVRSPGPVSSWSKKTDEGATAPAWNIHQYGYMGGASQGNQGISFGARRQITSQTPQLPSPADKERQRKEKEAEDERARRQQQQEDELRKAEQDREEHEMRQAEERRWEQETQRHRDEERQKMEEQKRRWAEEEKRWQEEEDVRRREERSLMDKVKKPPEKPRTASGAVLRGQSLSQYQREQALPPSDTDGVDDSPEQVRVKELERQLEEAREREKQYQAEREARIRQDGQRGSRPASRQTERPQTGQSGRDSEMSWTGDEREDLRKHWQASQETAPSKLSASITADEAEAPHARPSRQMPEPAPEETHEAELEEDGPPPPPPTRSTQPARGTVASPATSSTDRPLPNPESKSPFTRPANRTDAFLSSHPAPAPSGPRVSSSVEAGDTALEQSSLRDQRLASQQKTRAGGWASKSLLEREMERERERQREWEANQTTLKGAAKDSTQGVGEGQSWDVNQYGYMGGDGMNRGSSSGSGIAIGGRRQIIGPRPPP